MLDRVVSTWHPDFLNSPALIGGRDIGDSPETKPFEPAEEGRALGVASMLLPLPIKASMVSLSPGRSFWEPML
jgi:hypothetical protein